MRRIMEAWRRHKLHLALCRGCGGVKPDDRAEFCTDDCANDYTARAAW